MKPLYENDSGLQYIEKVDALLLADSRERIFQDFIINPLLQSVLPNYEIIPVDTKISGKAHDYSKYCGDYGSINRKCETPDLCIAKEWQWKNNDITKYIATIEIKTPYSDNEFWVAPGYDENKEVLFENKVSEMEDFINDYMLKRDGNGYVYKEDDNLYTDLKKQIGIHLRGINKVIITDGIRWLFFYKDKNGKCHALKPIDLGRRICKKQRKRYHHLRIEWIIKDVYINGRKVAEDLENYSKLKLQIQVFCQKDILEFKEIAEPKKKRIF